MTRFPFLFRMQNMSTLLNDKEDSLRKLKETLRRSQQDGDESCEFAVPKQHIEQPQCLLFQDRDSFKWQVMLLCEIQSTRVKISTTS